MVFGHTVLIAHIQLVVSLVHPEFRDTEITPASCLRREVAHPRHDAVEVAVVHATTCRIVQVHHIVEVGQSSIHPRICDHRQVLVRRLKRVLNLLESRERQKQPEILREYERIGGEAGTRDSMAV